MLMDIEISKIDDLNKICRVCMKLTSEMSSLWDLAPAVELNQHIKFADMLMECTSISVQISDGLPEIICLECETQLKKSYQFKNLCEKNDASLRNLVNVLNSKKTNNIIEDETQDDIIEGNTGESDASIQENNENQICKTSSSILETLLKQSKTNEDISSGLVKKYNNTKKSQKNGKRNIFLCHICSKNFSEKPAFISHLLTVHENCDVCDETFKEKIELLNHFYVHVSTATYFNQNLITHKYPHLCHACNNNYTSRGILIEHLKVHEKNKNFQCRKCKNIFSTNLSLMQHLKIHDIRAYICSACLLNFKSQCKYTDHLKFHKHHKKLLIRKEKFTCKICDCNYMTRVELKNHLGTHQNETYSCTECPEKFSTTTEFVSHKKQHKSNLCSFCGKQYERYSSLYNHIRDSHTEKQKFNCNICNKLYTSAKNLKLHQRIHSGERPYSCHTCTYSARTQSDLRLHIRTHTGEMPYPCKFPNCEKRFKTCSHRSLHYRWHTDERNHQCGVCNKKFLASSTLKIHMLQHSGLRPFKCDHCDKWFRRKHHLVQHRLNVHAEKNKNLPKH